MFSLKRPINHLFFTVCRIKTNTGLYTGWKSFIPFKYKINMIKFLIDRNHKICSSYQKIHNKFLKVLPLLLNKGYPRGIIGKHIKTYLNKKHQPLYQNRSETGKSKFAIFYLTYMGKHHSNLKKKLNSF